jgi:DNA (cytosine-5)-methyltransferase 1
MIPHPLASGAPKRLGRLRGYGNALCAPQAEAFVKAVMGCLP